LSTGYAGFRKNCNSILDCTAKNVFSFDITQKEIDTSDKIILAKTCPLCESYRIVYDFIINSNPVFSCNDCSHLFINPQPKSVFDGTEALFNPEKLRDTIKSEFGKTEQTFKTLEIGTSLLNNYNFELTRIEGSDISSFLEKDRENDMKQFDLCILNNILDYSGNPHELLLNIHKTLKDNGLLLFYIPVLDSKTTKKQKQKSPLFSGTRLHFFSTETIQNILCKSGYENIKIRPLDENGVFIRCRAALLKDERIISIIIPVYNEEKTISELLNNVMNKHLEGLKKEIIIVESNSKDSTRQIVKEFAAEHREIKLILEEKPRGKGHAVRTGFKEATGDFIAIQDGDLEYDINDYDHLIVPLKKYQKAFVLGSRHLGDWKIRKFGDNNKMTAAYVNFGHILLTGLINIGCGVKLKDPFTMYKLFRRECLSDLEFAGNRFEIDWEIIVKLIRKGYIPEEIPVNYESRGFDEGKKIALLKDPIICVASFFKYRYFYKMSK
jgi:SAM-dependent methyltransferase